MAADGQNDRLSGEEIFMILLLVIVIPVMLFAINFDSWPQVDRQLYRASRAESVRTGIAKYASHQTPSELSPLSADEAEQARPLPGRDQMIREGLEAAADTAQVSPEKESLLLSLIPSDFSLNGDGGPSAVSQAAYEQVKIKKPLLVNGEKVGNIEIYINSDGDPSVDMKEFVKPSIRENMKNFQIASRLSEKGIVRFKELREFGIDFRYSPTEDVIILNP
ncbi:hypothetical protein OIK40_00010 [Erythrobacter sp. sf7]|uniref:Uncharacterized protein n=1 Tax=Erythrobacter fulvus TaxID=2987523 RepID=A0ABT5JK25_9SPHN|nr:hypothetical protein [Erythrobacter fulvus]MDC8753022.1 hypothetical protein [Erythrobacter fulvus]